MNTPARCGHTVYVVEATDLERQYLRERWSVEVCCHCKNCRIPPNMAVSWRRLDTAWTRQVGRIGNLRVMCSIRWAQIDGQLIAFWESTSMVVDHAAINDHLAEVFPDVPRTTARNFHLVVHAIQRRGWSAVDALAAVGLE